MFFPSVLKMNNIPEPYKSAHEHLTHNKEELANSDACSCCYCLKTFSPSEIIDWVGSGGTTAICPYCDINAVLGSDSKLPFEDVDFLQTMYDYWF